MTSGRSAAGAVFKATLVPVDINIFEGFAYANGGRFLDEETETIMINGPGFVDALQLVVDMVNDGSTPSEFNRHSSLKMPPILLRNAKP